MNTINPQLLIPLQRTRVDVFEEIFLVFLGLGTLVGIVVVAYVLYNAYKYRDVPDAADPEGVDRPELGELPTGGRGGKKLFLSFGISAFIVIGLIVWTYGMLLYVEDGPDQLEEDALEVDVEAWAFDFDYRFEHQGEEFELTGGSDGLVLPADRQIQLNVTSRDVWHAWGLSRERVKADAIPGEYSETWFEAEETGYFENAVECFELCGIGHSSMQHDVLFVEPELFDAAAEEGALAELFGAVSDGDLAADASPEEFDEHLQEQRAEEEAEDGDGDGDGSGDGGGGDGDGGGNGDGGDGGGGNGGENQ